MPISKQENNEISEVLSSLGLNSKEQIIYKTVISLNQTTLTPIAKQAQLPLTTTQSIVERLVKQGFLNTTKSGSRHIYQASEPKLLEQKLLQQSKDFAAISPLLNELKTEKGGSTQIKIYYNDRIKDIFFQMLEAKTKIIYEIVSGEDIQKILGEKFHFSKRRVERNIYLKSLRVETHEIKKYSSRIHAKELREARFLPKELGFQTSIFFWDDTIAFFGSQNENLAWTIRSHAWTDTLKQLFSFLWQLSRPMITLKE